MILKANTAKEKKAAFRTEKVTGIFEKGVPGSKYMINTTVVLNSLSALPRAAIVSIIYKVIVMITTVGHSL